MKNNTVRVALTDGGNVLVVHQESELYNLLGKKESIIKTLFGELPDSLENFFRLHQDNETFKNEKNVDGDVKKLFDKFLSYYITCKVYNYTIDQNKFGFLKRMLSQFGQKLWSKIQRVSAKIAKNIIKLGYWLFC